LGERREREREEREEREFSALSLSPLSFPPLSADPRDRSRDTGPLLQSSAKMCMAFADRRGRKLADAVAWEERGTNDRRERRESERTTSSSSSRPPLPLSSLSRPSARRHTARARKTDPSHKSVAQPTIGADRRSVEQENTFGDAVAQCLFLRRAVLSLSPKRKMICVV
jgi:hypothetical protein